jgi:hypothetical protein
MKDPVASLTTGMNYEKTAIQSWISQRGNICPFTGRNIGLLIDNQELQKQIKEWKQQIKGYRRIQRGSPTTYCLVDAKRPPPSAPKPKTPETEQKEKTKEEMFQKVDSLLQTFTTAGMADHMNRMNKKEPETFQKMMLDPSNLFEEPAIYEYRPEYTSIFRQGPFLYFPSSSGASI